jgi:nucleotide-binding universal stress UspA family protein
LFSSVIDSVLQKSPCEVAVLHGEIHTRPIRNILIPYSEDIHTRLALEVAPALAGHFGSKVTLGVVMDPELSFAESDERLQRIRERLVEYNLSADIDVVTNDGILQGVIILSQRADLILMGGRTGDFMELLLRRSLVQEITEETHCPVLWIKEYEEKESFWISLLRSSPKEVDHHGQ